MSKIPNQKKSQLFKNRYKASDKPHFVPDKQMNDIYLSSHMDNLKNNFLNNGSLKTNKINNVEKTTIDNVDLIENNQGKKIISSNLRTDDLEKKVFKDENQKNIFLNSNTNSNLISDNIVSEKTINMKKKKKIIINRDEEKRNELKISENQNDLNKKIDKNNESIQNLNNQNEKSQNEEYFNYSLQNLDNRYGNQNYDHSQNLSGNDRDESQNLGKDHSYFTEYIYDKNKDVMKNNISEKIMKNELNKSDILKKKIKEDYIMFEKKINEKDNLIQDLSSELEILHENTVGLEDYNLLLEENKKKDNFITSLKNKINYLEKKNNENSNFPKNQNIDYYILLLQKKNEKIKSLIKDNDELKKRKALKSEYTHLYENKRTENKIKTINDSRYMTMKEYRPQYYKYMNKEEEKNVFQPRQNSRARVSTHITRISPEIEVRNDRNYEERERNRRNTSHKVTRYSISKTPSKGYKTFPFKYVNELNS